RALLLVFALMVTAAAAIMVVPVEEVVLGAPAGRRTFGAVSVALVAGGVGIGAGLVGAGGAFLLVPLLHVFVGVPIRVTVGSSLAITAVAATAGVVGKVVTGQVPLAPTLVVVVGAMPGAQLGALTSRRLSGTALKRALRVVIVLTGVRVWWHLLHG
ncbi:MAG TPA: sulfite exporter TauE/SafE family protein, partial [Methylomirabilota bacterium]|nr:sulfite exporter TauE/SafE family protein [Methylomirabilota bacterium]